MKNSLRKRKQRLERFSSRENASQKAGHLIPLVESSPIPAFNISAMGLVTYANKMARPILRAAGINVGVRIPHRYYKIVKSAMQNGGQARWQLQYGKRVYVFEGSPDSSGGYVGFVCVDITTRKALQSINKDRILAATSHEIRNPVNGILGIIELLEQTPLNEKQREYLKAIRFSSENILGITTDILDLSIIESGKYKLDEKPLSLHTLLKATLDTFRYIARKKGFQLIADIDPEVPARVLADRVRLSQIFNNLLGNAVKFTSKGHITLKVRLKKELKRKYEILCEVSDTGIGIPSSKLETIFESFEQGGSHVRSQYGGTGLGLPIVKQLIELHGGKIEVHSQPGKGTTFRFNLFLKKHVQDSVPANPPSSLQGCRILLVEDDHVNQLFLSEILTKQGATLTPTESGKNAIQLLKQQCFEVLLLDLQTRDIDGETVLDQLKSIPAAQNLTVIAMSGSLDKYDHLKNRCHAFIAKPFESKRIIETIKQFYHSTKQSFNPNLLEKYSHNDPELKHQLLDILISQIELTLKEIIHCYSVGDWQSLKRAAHRIKPNYALAGRADLEKLCEQLENMENPFNPAAINPLIDKLNAGTQRLLDEMKAHQSDINNKNQSA